MYFCFVFFRKRVDAVCITGFFESNVVSYQTSTFRKRFKVSTETFHSIVQEIQQYPEFTHNHVAGRPATPVDKCLAVTLWIMGNNETMDIAAERFDLCISTVHRIFHKTIKCVKSRLASKFIKWPSPEERPVVARDFARHRSFPGIIGAVDGCHIRILTPSESPESFINRKGYASIILQAVCDSDMMFTHCVIGWPGSVHDARVLNNSLADTAEQKCAPDFHIIGDSAYPLRWWLLTPFKDNGHLTPEQVHYNFYHSSTRMVIERAFGLIKGRFPILNLVQLSNIEDICDLILSACVFNNICLLHNEDVEEYLQGNDEHDANMYLNILPNQTQGIAKRTHITEYLTQF